MVGKTVSHYQITGKLGGGGMGVVYQAEDTRLGRSVALKFLPQQYFDDSHARERFQREARAASALDHPNICTIHSIGEHEGQPFIVMQYLEGQTLQRRIQQKPLTNQEILEIGSQVADALERAHSSGIIHRDIKPSNVFITRDGAKVLDFGLAKMTGRPREGSDSEASTWSGEAELTTPGTTMGTVSYMSPEQALGKELDPRTDIFSLGILLYEMCTRSLPFRGDSSTETIDSILHQAPTSPARVNPDVSNQLEQIINKCLEKDKTLRYQSAGEVLVDLKRVKRDCDPKSAWVTASTLQERRGRNWMKMAGGTVLLILALAALWSLGVFRLMGPESAGPVASGDLERSIAVLPFENLSGDPDQTYFSDGLTIEMIAQLSKISSLEKVIAFASSRRYRERTQSLSEIGRELGAALLLDGTVRQQGERVRVTVQLIEARERGQLWADTYEAELSDIFAVQSQIAEQIATALRVELSQEQKAQIERKPTENLTAYKFYLRGQDFRVRFNQAANENAIDFYQAALELDPEFALARAGLAYACALQGYLYGGRPRWLDTAVGEAQKALAIDPDLADAHVALAAAYSIKGWIGRARAASKKAIALSPHSDRGYFELGYVYASEGSLDDAYRQFREALELNPLHSYNYWSIGFLYLGLADFEKAEQWARQGLELQADDTMAHFTLWPAFLAQGRYQEAAEISQTLLALSPEDPKAHLTAGYSFMLGGDFPSAGEHFQRAYELAPDGLFGDQRVGTTLGWFLWETGEQAQANKLFARSLALNEVELAAGNQSSRPLTDTAFIHTTRGNTQEATLWLRRAVDVGYLGIDNPAWNKLSTEPEFQQMKVEVDTKIAKMRRRIGDLEEELGAGPTG